MKQLVEKYFAYVVLLVAVFAFLLPPSFTWVKTSYINYLLGFVMLFMGLTLKPVDFKIVFLHPKNVLIGCLAQFTIMPGLAWLLAKMFQLPPELTIGVILVGCCPGGTASNIITFLAKGDLALSVGMTAVSTVLAPIMTPFLTWLLAGAVIDVDVVNMFLSIVQVVIIPIVIGIGIQYLFPKFTTSVVKFLPIFSSLAIALIVGSVVSVNSANLHTVGIVIILVVVLHNACGYVLGYTLGRLMNFSRTQCIAISIEVGMQNSGLACSLAHQHFSVLQSATVPGAIFSVWHNISGALLARVYVRGEKKKFEE